jgi:uncharacterized protein with GYD domain
MEGGGMATFIMAMSINPSAKKTHPDLSKQINKSFDIFARNHMPVSNLFATLGRYDYLVIFEASDQGAAFKIALEINNLGVLETETWPVVPYEEFSKLIE